jgi:hypothetical protein
MSPIPIIPPLTECERDTILEDDNGKFRVIVIPQNPWAPVHEKLLSHTDDLRRLADLKDLVGGYIEVVKTDIMAAITKDLGLPSRHMICAVVDEDGWSHGHRVNARANMFYASDLVGDVLILCSAPDDEGGYDLVSLPEQVTVESITKWVLSHLD